MKYLSQGVTHTRILHHWHQDINLQKDEKGCSVMQKKDDDVDYSSPSSAEKRLTDICRAFFAFLS